MYYHWHIHVNPAQKYQSVYFSHPKNKNTYSMDKFTHTKTGEHLNLQQAEDKNA